MSAAVEMLRGACSRRLPGPDVTPEQLRNRSWYSGKDMFVIVDDYELVAGATNQEGLRNEARRLADECAQELRTQPGRP